MTSNFAPLNQITAIFDEETFCFVEDSIWRFPLVGDNVKNALLKACNEYRFLKKFKSGVKKGIDEQVVDFLLNPRSLTFVGCEEFLNKLEVWMPVLSEMESGIYFQFLSFSPMDIWELRAELIEILYAQERNKLCMKPAQLDPTYNLYLAEMERWGAEIMESSNLQWEKVVTESFSWQSSVDTN